jgi:hypothetical protein
MKNNINSVNTEVFSSFLAKKWDGVFNHAFPIRKHRAWKQWQTNYPVISSSSWFCANLREACLRYSWQAGDPAPLVAKMQVALASNKTDELFKACKDIFEWGGVARERKNGGAEDASLMWLKDQAAKSSLHSQISKAVELLKDRHNDLTMFNGQTLLMNSAMTKIYWAADPDKQLAIYDGRVGAALGLLAREFLKSMGCNVVPTELKFRWGGSRDQHVRGRSNKRNPSEDPLKFPSLFSSSKKDLHHAQMMRQASFLLKNVSGKLMNVSVHDLEKALFMIGYDVSCAYKIAVP